MSMKIRMFKSALLGLCALLAFAGSAWALDRQEAEIVVGIMEQVAAISGEPIYHGGGGELFDYDTQNGELIFAAGFDYDSWIAAHDAVLTGFMATIPEPEFNAIFAEPLAQLDASTSLTAEQKAAIRADLEPEIAAARAARQSGQAYADAVRPLLPRLQVLVFGE